VLKFWSLDNSLSKSILDVLETIYLLFRKTVVQRVAMVNLGLYDGGDNCFGGMKVRNTDLIGKGKTFVKYEAKVASRLSIVSIEVVEL